LSPVPAHSPYGGRGDLWDDTDCPDGVLGADGVSHHGWVGCRYRADVGVFAGAVCDMVWGDGGVGCAAVIRWNQTREETPARSWSRYPQEKVAQGGGNLLG